MTEYIWLIKFLSGMFLAYYIMSSRLRHFVNGFVIWFIRPPQPPKRKIKRLIRTEPILSKVNELELGSHKNGVVLEDDKLEEWFNNNPDLKEANTLR